MELNRVASTATMAVLALIVVLVFPAIVNAQSTPEPAMAPTSDGLFTSPFFILLPFYFVDFFFLLFGLKISFKEPCVHC